MEQQQRPALRRTDSHAVLQLPQAQLPQAQTPSQEISWLPLFDASVPAQLGATPPFELAGPLLPLPSPSASLPEPQFSFGSYPSYPM